MRAPRTGRSIFYPTSCTGLSTLSLHDALPIWSVDLLRDAQHLVPDDLVCEGEHSGQLDHRRRQRTGRSEEHTSELQSRRDLVCRLLLEKKKAFPDIVFEAGDSAPVRTPRARDI